MLVGSVQATLTPHERSSFIAYAVYPEHRGKGYAPEACRALIAYLRERYGVRLIVAEMDRNNEPSYGLAERLGFARVNEAGGEFRYELRLAPPH